jgi:hypothetical protein
LLSLISIFEEIEEEKNNLSSFLENFWKKREKKERGSQKRGNWPFHSLIIF